MSGEKTNQNQTSPRPKPWERDPIAWSWAYSMSRGIGLMAVAQAISIRCDLGAIGLLFMYGWVIVLVFAPAFESWRAERHYLWYGLLPLIMSIPWFMFALLIVLSCEISLHSLSWINEVLDIIVAPIGLGAGYWLLLLGPVSLYRYVREYPLRLTARLATGAKAAIEQDIEGSWPPNPESQNEEQKS